MMDQYEGPLPKDPKIRLNACEEAVRLRETATGFQQYLRDFVELWNNLPDVLKIKSWEWVEKVPRIIHHHPNSHSCPEGGVVNFLDSESLPRSYTALYGRLEFIFADKKAWHIPAAKSLYDVPKMMFHTGGGNATRDAEGHGGYSCYVTFWLEDVPKIWETYESLGESYDLTKLSLEDFDKVVGPIETLPKHLYDANKRVVRIVAKRLNMEVQDA